MKLSIYLEGLINICFVFTFQAMCLIPDLIQNGGHKVKNNNYYMRNGVSVGTQVHYYCTPGYKLVGDSILVCQSTGLYNPATPRCVPGMLDSALCDCCLVLFNSSYLLTNYKGYTILLFIIHSF